MRYSSVPAALAVFATAYAHPSPANGDHGWQAPGPGDVRGPCPMLNTLTNHGHLPRNGKGISKDMAVKVLSDVLNWDKSVVDPLYDFAQPTNPDPNATVINLDDLTTHNILEHDASLSRQDAHFGRADIFNATVWNETLAYFTSPTIDLAQAGDARHARLVSSVSRNPDFTLPETGAHFIWGESAAYQLVFGEWHLGSNATKDMVLTPKDLVQYFFVNERLPYGKGWDKPENRLNMTTLQSIVFAMQDLSLQ